MDFKFKDEDKNTAHEVVENEAPESDLSDNNYSGQQGPESKLEEGDVLEPNLEESTAAEGILEPYSGESPTAEDDVMEGEGSGVQVGGGGTVQGNRNPAAARPKYRIPLDDDDAKRPFSLPVKQILLVIALIGGGYYVKTYHGKEDQPTRVKNPPVVAVQDSKPTETSVEELSGLLNESKELLKRREEEANRLRNQASARRLSGNTGSRQISLQALKSYKGQWVTLRMKDGMEREGRIVDVKQNIVHLEQNYEYGTISVRVPMETIADIRE